MLMHTDVALSGAIIIIEMSEKLAEREAHFYLEVSRHHNIIQTLGTIENTSNLTIFIQDFAPLFDLASVLIENYPKIMLTMLMEMFLQYYYSHSSLPYH